MILCNAVFGLAATRTWRHSPFKTAWGVVVAKPLFYSSPVLSLYGRASRRSGSWADGVAAGV